MSEHTLLRLFCFGFEGSTLPDDLRESLRQGLGGVILFARNLRDLEQICALTAELHAHAGGPLLVGVDQEGGRVVRLPPPFLVPPAAAVLGHIGDPVLTFEMARAVGRELRAAGFNWNLAPVLDVHTNPHNSVIGDRAFSHDPDRVARMGLAALRGFEDAGILSTGKHFPGHGETSADSHQTLPESPQTAERWRSLEFHPFREAVRAGMPSLLAGHLACPALDPTAPSSLSRVILTDILRGELGYDDLVVSDDLEMGAIVARFDIGEAAVRFLEAGGDLILICRKPEYQRKAISAVIAAARSGRLAEARLQASLARLTRVYRRMPPQPFDATAARVIVGIEEHRALLDRTRALAAGWTPRSSETDPPQEPA
jgi:beta-N-acetylhexosaminidase